ncbi:Poly(A) polymerase central domain-containing protein [Umbelopsis sp. PMI_123]|nr:Poly(A) polymerase central domain-containing protein [Umbelopsis sp. PMI_123]KAH8548228.1 Poly(A) polymerase central domain-containing protein [Umbelopsis sp. PMI_123]KAH8548452.1 Poly(A) polymerase central domain-containing protein [Umbelopsis sp. PMI_123]
MSWTQYLKDNAVLEDSYADAKRSYIIEHLQSLVDRFTLGLATQKRIQHEPCRILPFGSYAIDAHLQASDMDLVCIAPLHLDHVTFLQQFAHILRQNEPIQVIEIVHSAPVPIIKFIYDNLPCDMSFARIPVSTLNPLPDLLNDALLEGIDEVDMRSLDGPRVNLYIAEIVRLQDKESFSSALRCIKHWAMNRGIYGKPMGYLNGGTWTLLLAKTYLTFRRADYTVHQLLSDFFNQWSHWEWATPVLLDHLHNQDGLRIEFEQLPEFQNDLMPILTPCYPYKSANPYATRFSMKVLQQELQRAYAVVTAVGNSERTSHLVSKLFKPLEFDRKYKHYLDIIMFCESTKQQEKWKGKLAACIPTILQLLETNNMISLAHAWIDCHTSVYAYRTQEELSDLVRGVFVDDPMDYYRNNDLNPGTMFRLDYYIGLKISPSTIDPLHGSVVDLVSQTSDFIQDVQSKMSKSDQNIKILVKAIKRRDVKLSNA